MNALLKVLVECMKREVKLSRKNSLLTLGGPNFFLAFFDSGINLKCMLLTLQDKLGVLVAHITDSSAVEEKKITKSGLIGPLTWLNHNT